MYALSHYTRGTLGLVNLFCRAWSISSLNGVKFYAEGGKWECRHQYHDLVGYILVVVGVLVGILGDRVDSSRKK